MIEVIPPFNANANTVMPGTAPKRKNTIQDRNSTVRGCHGPRWSAGSRRYKISRGNGHKKGERGTESKKAGIRLYIKKLTPKF